MSNTLNLAGFTIGATVAFGVSSVLVEYADNQLYFKSDGVERSIYRGVRNVSFLVASTSFVAAGFGLMMILGVTLPNK